MNFKDITFRPSENDNIFSFNGHEIKVRKYLPIEEKFDLIMITLQKSIVEGSYNPVKLHAFFDLHIAYLYTDIIFDIEDRANEAMIYDVLTTSGLMAEIKSHIEESEMACLTNLFKKTLAVESARANSAAGIISKLVDDLPRNVEAAKQTVETFDPEKYQQVMDFAKAINGGRPI